MPICDMHTRYMYAYAWYAVMQTHDMHTHDLHTHDMHTHDMQTNDMHTHDMHTYDLHNHDMHTHEIKRRSNLNNWIFACSISQIFAIWHYTFRSLKGTVQQDFQPPVFS